MESHAFGSDNSDTENKDYSLSCIPSQNKYTPIQSTRGLPSTSGSGFWEVFIFVYISTFHLQLTYFT
jgi:hypothetical protein